MSNLPDRWRYYCIGGLLVALGLLIFLFWDATLANFLLGLFVIAVGLITCFWVYRTSQLENSSDRFESEEFTDATHRTVYTGGGNYNESIQGDYINVQGNHIYLNQDLAHVTAQIQEVLSHLKSQGYSQETSEKQVAEDLRACARLDSNVREKLLQWKKYLDSSSSQSSPLTEASVRVAREAFESSSTTIEDPILVVDGKYKKLYELLKNGSWEEADAETVRLVLNLMPERGYHLDVDQIAPKDLKRINQLWVKYSNGRFGFSVQQSIWKKLFKVYNHTEYWNGGYWVEEDAYCAFMDCIGWPREDDRIYHGDFNYSLKAPKGHLPAFLMLDFRYYKPSNYAYLNKEVFNDLMRREYYKSPSIPSWLKRWLSIEN